MGSQNRSKINQLLRKWPKGTVVTRVRLDELGIYRQLVRKYIQSGWIESLGSGAFIRSDDEVDWRGGVFALQTQLGLTIHVGGRTALELQGRAHYLVFGERKRVILISDTPERQPAWFRNHNWKVEIKHYCLSLFDNPPKGIVTQYDCGGFQVAMSSLEQAIMEEIRISKTNEELSHVYQLMEGLNTLRPDVVQKLLENCRSVKVKRFFLWCAESVGHAWFSRLTISNVDLGKGKRQFFKGGCFNEKYQITVPNVAEELPNV